MKVKAPKGFHWMKNGKSFKLMKHAGKFVKHKGASLTANFAVQKVHKKKQENKMPAKKKTHKTKDGRTARKGLYYNINKKRKEGKKMRKKGAKGAPTAAAFKRSAKTAKKPKKKSKKK